MVTLSDELVEAIGQSVLEILDDIRGRQGLGDELEQIDNETFSEMVIEWQRIILRKITKT